MNVTQTRSSLDRFWWDSLKDAPRHKQLWCNGAKYLANY